MPQDLERYENSLQQMVDESTNAVFYFNRLRDSLVGFRNSVNWKYLAETLQFSSTEYHLETLLIEMESFGFRWSGSEQQGWRFWVPQSFPNITRFPNSNPDPLEAAVEAVKEAEKESIINFL